MTMLIEQKEAGRKKKKTAGILTAWVLAGILACLFLAGCAGAGKQALSLPEDLDRVTTATAELLMEETPQATAASVGGDWLIRGLVFADCNVPDAYYDQYRDNVRAVVKSSKGVLSERHYTEYARVILGLESIGTDVRDVEGYDLTAYLDDYEKMTDQGPNASCFALIAAEEAGIRLGHEEDYISSVLEDLRDPAYTEDKAYADYLAIGIEAMSFYRDRADVAEFVDRAVEDLSALQQADGSLGSCETTAECIVALVQAGINPLTDARFRKEEKTLGDGLLLYYLGDGAFCHILDSPEKDLMACEKALLALDAIRLYEQGGKLYE